MYHPSDLAAMDPLVLMKNLDHVRMTSRRLSYILQQQVHLYVPEANELREQDGGTIGVSGSPTLVRSLIDAGLLDELCLMISPVVAGCGWSIASRLCAWIGSPPRGLINT